MTCLKKGCGLQMLIDKKTALAYRCSKCGMLEIHQLNIFNLSGGKTVWLRCECGHDKLSVARNARKVIVKPYCVVCGQNHELSFSEKKFWSKTTMQNLSCPRSGLNLGYYGPFSLLHREVEKQRQEIELLTDGLGFENFVDPEIMLAALDLLHEFATRGDLNCECGSSEVAIDLLPDRIEITCLRCQGSMGFSAVNLADIKFLEEKDHILLKYNNSRSPLNPGNQ